MKNPREMPESDWDKYAEEHDLPHDACITWARKHIVFVDGGFTSRQHPPLWYRANNRAACMSNCQLVRDKGIHVSTMKWTICLVTKHVVPTGDQLMFSYDDAGRLPRDWIL